jgi:hypothetical protein
MTTAKHAKAQKKTSLEDAPRVTPGYKPSSSIQRPDLAVYCPTCGAGPGTICTVISRGITREKPHRTRRLAAARGFGSRSY